MPAPIKLRASSLSAKAVCGAWQSKPFDTALTKAGTARHAALEDLLKNGKRERLEALPEDDREGVQYAADYIFANSSSEHKMMFERSGSAKIEGVTVSGRFDCVAGDQGFDLKWRTLADKSYIPQIAFYALMAMDINGLDQFTYHLIYGSPKVTKIIDFTKEEAEKIVRDAIKNALRGVATPCGWCSWCNLAAECPALNATVITVAKSHTAELALYDPRQLSDPKMLARALTMARALKAWQDDVERKAKDAALSGVALEGFQLTERNPPRRIADLNRAFNIIAQESGMDAGQFMHCCTLQQGKLIDAFASATGVTKAKAKVTVKTLLADVFQQQQQTKVLTKIMAKYHD